MAEWVGIVAFVGWWGLAAWACWSMAKLPGEVQERLLADWQRVEREEWR